MTICHCPGACDCLEQDDTLITGAWDDIDQATTPKRLAGAGPLSTGEASQPPLRLVAVAVPPSDPRPENGRGSHPPSRRMARQERAARNALRPRTGQVFAFPRNPPDLNESGGPSNRPAA